MSHKFPEREFAAKGFSGPALSWLRSVEKKTASATISLDLTEIESLIHIMAVNSSRLDSLEKKLNQQQLERLIPIFDKKDFITSVISSNYTTKKNEILICEAEIEVTLNTLPRDREEVVIVRNTTAGPITVTGTINGDSNYVMLSNHESKTFKYVAENSEWVIV